MYNKYDFYFTLPEVDKIKKNLNFRTKLQEEEIFDLKTQGYYDKEILVFLQDKEKNLTLRMLHLRIKSLHEKITKLLETPDTTQHEGELQNVELL